MKYKFCGNSGLQLPQVSLGLWHNFGDVDDFSESTSMLLYAFDQGITHFDLANNYGPPPGSAEANFGKIWKKELASHRDEVIVSSKVGHKMWDGPYGDGGSRKSIMASINQSLKRTGLEYFDIFYSHRYDSQTPIEETLQALVDIVRQGKALYIGLSKYPPEKAEFAYQFLKSQHVPCLIYQDKYNMITRKPEVSLMPLNEKYGVGFISFSPLEQGILTDKYLKGIPLNSRAHKSTGFLQQNQVTTEIVDKMKKLNSLAQQRNESLAEMALAWLLQKETVTSVIVGASSLLQLKNNLKAINSSQLVETELEMIDEIVL